MKSSCHVCFRKCLLSEGKRGVCGARECLNGKVVPGNYGRISSMALDPVEKKPFRHFMPGSYILSVGSTGCNLRCPFCQNSEISWSEEAMRNQETSRYISPEDLVSLAEKLKPQGNIGVAFTYNEPLISYEYVRDTSMILHERGLKSVVVTNGTADISVLNELLGLVDAMNIDLKGFTSGFYQKVLKGDLEMVKRFITVAVTGCHVELTTLIIPGENDSDEEIRELARWVASLKVNGSGTSGSEIPLHITRFFPAFMMTDRMATDVASVYHLAAVAGEYLKFVYPGNC